MVEFFVGIDVQLSRPCPMYVLGREGEFKSASWLPKEDTPEALHRLVAQLADGDADRVAIGIDAPRGPMPKPRQWSFSRTRWARIGAGSPGHGRHCEVVIAALRLANPQWTPSRENAPDWMRLGFELFVALASFRHVHEVFPSASYSVLQGSDDVVAPMHLNALRPAPKDMLDAMVAAVTVREFVQGRGCEVGGGDGLGTIILPRPVVRQSGVHAWPG